MDWVSCEDMAGTAPDSSEEIGERVDSSAAESERGDAMTARGRGEI